MRPIGRVLAKFPDAKSSGSGWSAQCPAHDDHAPSLSIGEGADGRVLLKCHTGCAIEDICSKIGLTVADLFPDPPKDSKKQRVVERYAYCDKNGVPVYQVERLGAHLDSPNARMSDRLATFPR